MQHVIDMSRFMRLGALVRAANQRGNAFTLTRVKP